MSKSLGNPVLIAEATNRSEIVKQTTSVIPFLIKTVVILGVGYYLYNRYTNRFVALKEKTFNPPAPANVTLDQAKTRADAIASSIGWFSNDFNAVADALAGLNYNGFVRVYNAFGHQTGTLFGGDLNLIEWIKNQFSTYEVQQLSSLQNGIFFRSNIQISPRVIAMNDFLNQFSDAEKLELETLIFG